ncbi:TonB-dependent receptor [Hoeflea sp. CAU 1731]
MSLEKRVFPGRGESVARALALSLAAAGAATALTSTMAVPTAMAQEQVYTVNIPEGPLSAALNRLADQTGLQIGYDSAVVSGLTTTGLNGSYTAGEALDLLLSGSNIEASYSDASTVTLTELPPLSTDGLVISAEGATVLDTITVVGEKLPRDLFNTYTSVGVVTGTEIEDYDIVTIDQALNRTANVLALPTSTGNNSISIRGLNAEGVTQPSARTAPVISMIVDGASLGVEALRRGSRGVWDVDQIEVLRGPQSTLQGRNALAGAVVVETKDPTFEEEFIFDGEVGTNDYYNGAFVVSGPIIPDNLAIRIAGQAWRETADIRYVDPAISELGKDEFEQIRGKILFTPEDLPGFSALFTISHTHDKPAWNAVSGPDYFARIYDDASGSGAEFRDTTVTNYIADLSYEITPNWTIQSISAYSNTDVIIESPEGSIFDRYDTRDIGDFSQDITLTFESPDSPFSGVFGLFYGDFRTDIDSDFTTSYFAPYIPVVDVQQLVSENRTESIAAYADLRYEFTDRWTLMAGGRLLQDKISVDIVGTALDFEQTLINGYPVYGSLDENGSTTNTEFLPKIGLAFDIADNQTISLFAAKGYRAGFTEVPAGSTEVNEVEPEYLWDYEVGYRSLWLNDTLQFNANAFYYDYTNQQLLIFNPDFPGQTITENVGKSHAYGAEFEVRYMPTTGLELFTTLGLLKTEFDEAETSDGDFAGNEFPEAPAFTATIGGVYRHQSGFYASASVSYTDGYYSSGDLANTRSRYMDAFTLVDASIGYEAEYASFSLFARNLFDEQYLTSINDTGSSASIGEGRTIGLKANVRF